MRIIIDCFKQIKGTGKSIGIYNVTLSLIQNLVKEKEQTLNNKIRNSEIIILGNKYNKKDFDICGVEFIEIKYNALSKLQCIFWELFGVTRICKKLNADKVLFPRGYCALTHPIYDVILIHDLIPFYYNKYFPKVFGKIENSYIMARLKSSAKSAKQIITISNASRDAIIKYCNVSEDKIVVIHNACNIIQFNEEKQLQAKPYICAMTSELPHKNAKGILESYVKYYKKAENPLRLVIIGIKDTFIYDLPEQIKNNIICCQYIKDNSELYRIINNCKVFLFLSLIEGFGLPPIEAMQLHVPVICSNVSSIPEVTGDAAILVNPNDSDKVAEAMVELINNECKQRELINRGIENVKRFSWYSRAKLYWNVLTENPGGGYKETLVLNIFINDNAVKRVRAA